MVVLLAGRGFTRRQGLTRIKNRLQKERGCENVRLEPSRYRPRSVIADVNIVMFLSERFPRSEAKLEVSWRPRTERDVQRVQWADEAGSFGWHKDDDHRELGTTHFQLERQGNVHHSPAGIEVETPLSFLEASLRRIPDRLDETVEDE